MAVTHLVRTILRPGVQSIQVQYKYQSAEVWTNYNEGQRIPGGVEVKFTVTTYSNFTLTEWKAWYADEYDDTVDLTLTGITGESAWTFILPSADVYIRCEAEYSGGESDFPMPYPATSENFVITGSATIDEVCSYMVSLGYADMRAIVSNWSYWQNRVAEVTQNYALAYFVAYVTNMSSIPEDTTAFIGVYNTIELPYSGTTADRKEIAIYTFTRSGNSLIEGRVLAQTGVPVYLGLYGLIDYDRYQIGASKGYYVGQSDATIRYIMSPENSGEIDNSAPSVFEQGTTEFTFKWRIKTGYSLKRITPFAVGEGSLEDDALYSSGYDGETRTYTVTVQQIPNWAIGVRVLIECTNHNDPNVGGNSNPGGGDGTFDETSDPVPIEPMPSISAADAGLITLFRPSLAELKGLGAYLWTNIEDFIVNLQKMFSNPMDTIIALNILPGLPPVGTPRNIRLGLWETNIAMSPVLSQWYEIDFGSVNISEFWGSALDYSPNTKIHAMLPFIGSVQLNTDDVMGTTVGLVYRVDLLSGHLVAMITVNDNVLYQFTGECAVAVPLTGADWSRVYGAIAGTIGAVAIGAAGAAAAGTATAGLSQTATAAQHVAAQADFDYMTAATYGASQGQLRVLDSSARQLNAAAMNAVGRRNAAEAAKVAGAVALGSNTVNQIMGAKFQIAHSGTISGSAGLLGVRRPYIYIEYPNQSLPENYKHFYGYPSNMHANLSSLSGFTQCYQVLLTGVNGTDGEIAEILELLKEGVYL